MEILFVSRNSVVMVTEARLCALRITEIVVSCFYCKVHELTWCWSCNRQDNLCAWLMVVKYVCVTVCVCVSYKESGRERKEVEVWGASKEDMSGSCVILQSKGLWENYNEWAGWPTHTHTHPTRTHITLLLYCVCICDLESQRNFIAQLQSVTRSCGIQSNWYLFSHSLPGDRHKQHKSLYYTTWVLLHESLLLITPNVSSI